MRWMKWIGIIASGILIASCFIPWVVISYKNIVVSGVESTGTIYGRPVYFNFVLAIFYIFFSFIDRVWSKRCNLFIVAINMAWAIRNYIMVTTCYAGECPDKKLGLYLMLGASAGMLLGAFFPGIKLKERQN
jgi:hypothetical protein